MHTQIIEDRDGDESGGQMETVFNYCPDMGGDVNIRRFNRGSKSSEPVAEMIIPAWQLLEFIADRVQHLRICQLEQMDAHEILGIPK